MSAPKFSAEGLAILEALDRSPRLRGGDVNLRLAGEACGKRINCPRCRASMDAITVGEVREALAGILERATARSSLTAGTSPTARPIFRSGWRRRRPG